MAAVDHGLRHGRAATWQAIMGRWELVTVFTFVMVKTTVLKHGCEDDFHIWVDSESRATREMCPLLQMAPGWAGLSIEPIYAEIHGP